MPGEIALRGRPRTRRHGPPSCSLAGNEKGWAVRDTFPECTKAIKVSLRRPTRPTAARGAATTTTTSNNDDDNGEDIDGDDDDQAAPVDKWMIMNGKLFH